MPLHFQRRMKRAASILAGLLLACAAVGCQGAAPAQSSPAPTSPQGQFAELANLYFMGLEDKQQVGVTQAYIDYKGACAYAIEYPATGNEMIDARIKEIVAQIRADFDQTYAAFVADGDASVSYQTGFEAELYVGYQTYLGVDKTLSVVFEESQTVRNGNSPYEGVHTHVFDLSSGKELNESDVWKEGYRAAVSAYAAKHFGNATFAEDLIEPSYREHIADAPQNFTQYALTNDGVRFYFDKYSILPGSYGIVQMDVPYAALADVLNVDITQSAVVPEPNTGMHALPAATETAAPTVAPTAAPSAKPASTPKPAATATPAATNPPASARKIDPNKPMVALTFDDGPSVKYGNQILDTLEKHGQVATFFELGNLMAAHPQVDQRAAGLGCEIGSHTYSHKNLNKLTAEQVKEEIAKTDEVFKRVLGHPSVLIRPPYGNINKTVQACLGEHAAVNWSVDTLDWKSKNVEQIIETVKKEGNLDGKVILMHSIYASSAQAVEELVPYLLEQGYQLVTVSELITYKHHESIQMGKVYGYRYFR